MLAVLRLLALFVSLPYSVAATYTLRDNVQGSDFLDWYWETFDDPTHGRVNYVDLATALDNNYTGGQCLICLSSFQILFAVNDNGQFYMKSDSSNPVFPAARGRDSIRITSNVLFTDLVMVDIAHMPVGCATWPAFWTLSKNGPWPNGGELDIIEGMHLPLTFSS